MYVCRGGMAQGRWQGYDDFKIIKLIIIASGKQFQKGVYL
jgi:hypothetical protein